MRIEQIKYLLHIAGSGSITRSAEALSISQQGLSQTIHQLERELNVKLLYREGNRTKLTAMANQLRPDMERMLESYDNMLNSISAKAMPAKKQFCHLRVTPHFCISAMPRIIQRMSRLYPNLLLNVIESQFLDVLRNASFENDELFILTCPERFIDALASRPGVIAFQELQRSKIHALLSMNHPLSDRDYITIDDLCQYPLTVLGSDIEMLRSISGNRFGDLRIRLHTTNFELYRAAIGMRDNIALSVPLASDLMNTPHLRHTPLMGAETIIYGYVINNYARSSPVVMELLHLLESEVRRLQGEAL